MTSRDRDLDKVLAGKAAPDDDSAEMAETARRLEEMFDADAPEAPGTRALFAAAVATRRRPTVWRYVAPAMVATSLLVAVYYGGRVATPGQPLYPLRQALQEVDLAPATADEVADRLANATTSVVEAEAIVEASPHRARALATRALKLLGAAETLLDDLPREEADVDRSTIDRLETRALAVLFLSFEEEEPEAIEERADELEDRDDSSGSGSGSDDDSGSDDSGSDDSSGSGSDDNSGSGSGSDDGSGGGSGSDDNSGPGSN